MSRLVIPDVHRQAPLASEPAEPPIQLTRAELDKELAAAEERGYRAGAQEAEDRVRGSERAELADRAEALAIREKECLDAQSQAASLLKTLGDETTAFNKRLDAVLNDAAVAMGAHLLMKANSSAEMLQDLLAGLQKHYRITAISVSVPQAMKGVMDNAEFDLEHVTLTPAEEGKPLSIRLQTEAGELQYGLQEIAAELHTSLLAAGEPDG